MNKFIWAFRHPLDYYKILRFSKLAKDFRPKKIDINNIFSWLDQFPEEDHSLIISLLPYVIYYSEQKTKDTLIKHNKNILDKLGADGIKPGNIIYVTLAETASSSHVLLNMLRDEAKLERMGVRLIDSKNLSDLIEVTNNLGNGAIIYIDDFSGTGKQFLESRNFIARNVPLISQFSEFFLLSCVCQEAFAVITKEGVEVVSDNIHSKNERPLHPDSILLSKEDKERLLQHCKKIDNSYPLGYAHLASMMVSYRNTPNTVPVLLRGNVGQDELIGLIPRVNDLHRIVG